MIKPSRLSLLSNFLNSHPLTYHRIAALLSDDLTPFKVTLLPFICLKISKQKEYAKKFEVARTAFKIIANEKFRELFDVAEVSALLESLGVKEFYKFDLSKNFLFKNKITNEIILGKLEDVHFIDDICSPDQYFITDLKTNQKYFIDSSIYKKFEINLNEIYFLKKNLPLNLIEIELTEDKKEGNYVFLDKDNNRILKSINETKLPNSVKIIRDLNDQDIFFKLNGELKIYKCVQVVSSEIFDEYELTFKNFKEADKLDEKRFKIRELIISPRNLNLTISRNSNRRKSEIEIVNWLLNNQVLSTIYLKKPVNNIEFGYIQALNVEVQNSEKGTIFNELNNKESIRMKNIFGQEKILSFDSLEHISFEFNTVTILKKTDTSFFSKLGYQILKKFDPKKIFYLVLST